MAVGSAELGDNWMIVSIGVSIISFSLTLKASRRSDEPDLRLETFSAGTDFPRNIFLVTTEKVHKHLIYLIIKKEYTSSPPLNFFPMLQ